VISDACHLSLTLFFALRIVQELCHANTYPPIVSACRASRHMLMMRRTRIQFNPLVIVTCSDSWPPTYYQLPPSPPSRMCAHRIAPFLISRTNPSYVKLMSHRFADMYLIGIGCSHFHILILVPSLSGLPRKWCVALGQAWPPDASTDLEFVFVLIGYVYPWCTVYLHFEGDFTRCI
jgi:hypothetical protein